MRCQTAECSDSAHGKCLDGSTRLLCKRAASPCTCNAHSTLPAIKSIYNQVLWSQLVQFLVLNGCKVLSVAHINVPTCKYYHLFLPQSTGASSKLYKGADSSRQLVTTSANSARSDLTWQQPQLGWCKPHLERVVPQQGLSDCHAAD